MSFSKIFSRVFDNNSNNDNQAPTNGSGEPQAANTTASTDKTDKTDKTNQTKQGEDVLGNTNYNLIILDESGSMYDVRKQTISGCNETLSGIRHNAEMHPEIKQFVSIYCFDSVHSRYIFKNVPIQSTRELEWADYCPNACTPLYDAVGDTVSQLRKLVSETNAVGMVTIITDGLENASRRWTGYAVLELIESLKKKGWVFSFLGANIDVEETSRHLGINSFMEFDQSDEGMKDMFENTRRSHTAHNEKMAYMRKRNTFLDMDDSSRRVCMSHLNDNWFVEKERIAPDHIEQLAHDEVFVFGSNIHGRHDGGAAFTAFERFGAVPGQAEGIQGQSYAIPTVGNTFEDVKAAVDRFTEYVVMNPQKKFMLTAVGCGAVCYQPSEIAPLFRQAYLFGNVYVPRSFMPYME